MENNVTLFTTPGNITVNTTIAGTLCHVTEPYKYVFAAVLILLSTLGTIENTLILTAMFKFRILRTQSTILIGALATIDLLTSALVIPLFVVLVLNPSVPWHNANIKLMSAIVALSLLTAVYISVDRFAHVYYLQKYSMTQGKSIAGLVISWIAPFVLYAVVRGSFKWFNLGQEAGRAAGRVTAAVLITLCIVLIMASYVGILVLLRRHAKDVSDTLRTNYLETQSRASKTSLTIVSAVVLMNAPTLFYNIILSTGSDPTTWFCTITLITLLGSSALNPLVYCLRMSTMKKHVLMLLGCRGGKNKAGEEEARLRMMSCSNATRTGSLSIERNMSVTIVKNKDSLKLLKRKDQALGTAAV